jgi:hypothetical protein
VQITNQTSPEDAIKIAYDFARSLRVQGASVVDLPLLLGKWVEEVYRHDPRLTYIRGGFVAGFHFAPLPWRRHIDRGDL